MKLIWRVSVMAVALMGLMATTAAPVSAATYDVWGELNTGGAPGSVLNLPDPPEWTGRIENL